MGKTFFAFILIAILGVLAYSNSFRVPFQFDDNSSIVNNTVIHDLGNFTASLEGFHYNPRRVVGYATFALNYHFSGLNTTAYHVVNLIIHVVNGILVYLLIILTFRTPYFNNQSEAVPSDDSKFKIQDSTLKIQNSKFLIALFSALLFVVHPLQTEAVTYIVQRFASLATMFYLLSIVFYIKGRLGQKSRQANKLKAVKDGNPPSSHLKVKGNSTISSSPLKIRHNPPLSPLKLRGDEGGLWPVWYILSLLAALLAAGTKEIAYTLPFIVVIFEFFFFTSGVRRRLLFMSLFVTAAAAVGIMVFIRSGLSPADLMSRLSALTMVQSYGSRSVYFLTELRVIMSYIRLVFLPVNQTIDYDYPIYHSFLAPQVLLSALFLLTLLGVAVYLLVRSRPAGPKISPYYRLAAFGVLWFFIALSVESSVIPIADVIFEHRMYLPSVGAMIAIVAVSFTLAGRLARNGRTTAVIIFAVIVTLFAAATYSRNEVWASPMTLWKDAIRKAPHHSRPYFSLGAEYAKRGDYQKAIEMYQKALAMPPREYLALKGDEYPRMYNAVGLLYAKLGRYDEAIDVFQGLLSRYPDFAGAYNNLGAAYVNSGRYREAIQPLLQAIDRKPDNLDARYNLALAYYGAGDRNAAMRQVLILKRFSPKAASDLRAHFK